MSSEIETFVYEMRDYIRANFNTYLNAINAGEGDGMNVEAVKDTNIDLMDLDPFSHNEYPVIDIYPTDVEVGHLAMGSDELGIRCTALIALNKGGTSVASKKIMRYIEAFRQAMRAADEAAWDVDPDEAVTIAVYPSAETEIKIASITWRAIKDIGV